MKHSDQCEKFLKDNGVNCVSVLNIETEDEGHFSWSGCDCCKNRLGTTVYDCYGYDPKQKKAVEIGQICHDCICYFYNGDERQEA